MKDESTLFLSTAQPAAMSTSTSLTHNTRELWLFFLISNAGVVLSIFFLIVLYKYHDNKQTETDEENQGPLLDEQRESKREERKSLGKSLEEERQKKEERRKEEKRKGQEKKEVVNEELHLGLLNKQKEGADKEEIQEKPKNLKGQNFVGGYGTFGKHSSKSLIPSSTKRRLSFGCPIESSEFLPKTSVMG